MSICTLEADAPGGQSPLPDCDQVCNVLPGLPIDHKPRLVAVDPFTDYVYYWNENSLDHGINVYKPGPPSETTKIVSTSMVDEPVALALDSVNKKIYYANATANTIFRCNLDGSEQEPAIQLGTNRPHGFAADPKNGKLYLATQTSKGLFNIDLTQLGGSTPPSRSDATVLMSDQSSFPTDATKLVLNTALQGANNVGLYQNHGWTLGYVAKIPVDGNAVNSDNVRHDWVQNSVLDQIPSITIGLDDDRCQKDGDGDGIPDCFDDCPDDPTKTVPGKCGCGKADTDSDGDGTKDCNDECPNDDSKILEGECGCDSPETGDIDNDGTHDCNEDCPKDPDKTTSGDCGCGIADTDSDLDGTADCNDKCSDDPAKNEEGDCGCGVADKDTDSDGSLDCQDGCPSDAAKTEAGQCGCGEPETGDTDGDDIVDCKDACPDNRYKFDRSHLPCGTVSDENPPDDDNDDVPTYEDQCPANPFKHYNHFESVCSDHNNPQLDSDGDGVPDFLDECTNNPNKTENDPNSDCVDPNSDKDSDGDGVPDGQDGCTADPLKTEPGQAGCGSPETDSDGDGIDDRLDEEDWPVQRKANSNTIPLRPLVIHKGRRTVRVHMEKFSGWEETAAQSFSLLAAKKARKKKRSGKLSIRYKTVLTGYAGGKRVRRRRISRRNKVLFRKLPKGSYTVRYRVQVRRKKTKVGQTHYSPSGHFSI